MDITSSLDVFQHFQLYGTVIFIRPLRSLMIYAHITSTIYLNVKTLILLFDSSKPVKTHKVILKRKSCLYKDKF